ncbi:PIN domain-like protein [Coprinopsis marcescibilis]|uniref:PIN domain-like protein n=1 Tax=Coprinopsis marcescibilis TaxID=230819 RepID=A0A5C3KLY5_COPMA|nr:PIN domain-like protein [Coprinopsis marcescibilis]
MGVKSLWSLLTPVGRPVMLETMEGKVMAIDSSIWIYQFQATMRDKEGRGLANAHVLGFLRRIAKLLFFGIKPVFVFDGGAPELKRSTLNERRKKKTGAALSHARLAERLLAARMRREAVEQAKGKSSSKTAAEEAEGFVYLEDLEPDAPKTPIRPKPLTPSSTAKKQGTGGRYHDHDPYKLPHVDLEAVITERSQPSAPDERLATEEELRSFIEDMRPEDFDLNSPGFRELPTEVQYEIIGDLRLKSRQTSFARLQKMLNASKTPLDFSKQQIANLRQRNALTQQLLLTTDSIGSANIRIPVRIASERNREYVLIKNNDEAGGWILGVRDTTGTTREKPIEIDQDPPAPKVEEKEESDDDEDMEEVEVPSIPTVDPDLRAWQQENALAALSKRNTDKGLAPLTTKPPAKPIRRKPKANPLFNTTDSDYSDDDPLGGPILEEEDEPDAYEDDDEQMAFALQQSFDQARTSTVRFSTGENDEPIASSSAVTLDSYRHSSLPQTPNLSAGKTVQDEEDGEDMYVTPPSGSRLETALRFANVGSLKQKEGGEGGSAVFGRNVLLGTERAASPTPQAQVSFGDESDSDEDMEAVPIEPLRIGGGVGRDERDDVERGGLKPGQADMGSPLAPNPTAVPAPTELFTHTGLLGDAAPRSSRLADAEPRPRVLDESDDEMEEVGIDPAEANANANAAVVSPRAEVGDIVDGMGRSGRGSLDNTLDSAMDREETAGEEEGEEGEGEESMRDGVEPLFVPSTRSPSLSRPGTPRTPDMRGMHLTGRQEDEGNRVESDREQEHDDHDHGRDRLTEDHEHEHEPEHEHENEHEHEHGFDAAAEMDLHAEEGEFAKFVSEVKGRDLNQVRKEIDEEIMTLNQQRMAAMRDAEDVSVQMINQIMMMLRLFGIPYVTAPMEAEAQCAELVSLGLVDGVITDDSDVFLFGAARVFKNMFNQSKTVECFLLSDLEKELGLDRDTLVQLAYLLGSDYTEGISGVGPVVAMELLKEFPGKEGLWRFKEWWMKVQMGKDGEESGSKFRKMFKRKFKDLYISSDWPNTAVVSVVLDGRVFELMSFLQRDAYYHPNVDSSDEPFKWAMPDLDGLRTFLKDELGWSQTKVDELLLPIIQKVNRRSREKAVNRQGNLNDFFEIGQGSGTVAPRQRQAYASKRLQQVVKEFRRKRVRSASAGGRESGGEGEGESEQVSTKKRRKAPVKGKSLKGKGKGKKKQSEVGGEDGSDSDEAFVGGAGEEVPLKVELRPRPKPRPRARAQVDTEVAE